MPACPTLLSFTVHGLSLALSQSRLPTFAQLAAQGIDSPLARLCDDKERVSDIKIVAFTRVPIIESGPDPVAIVLPPFTNLFGPEQPGVTDGLQEYYMMTLPDHLRLSQKKTIVARHLKAVANLVQAIEQKALPQLLGHQVTTDPKPQAPPTPRKTAGKPFWKEDDLAPSNNCESFCVYRVFDHHLFAIHSGFLTSLLFYLI